MSATTEAPTTVTYEDYARARDALGALVGERARVLPRGLEALRRWLAAGAGERWLHYERVVTRARDQDLALAMWWEFGWRRSAGAAPRSRPAGARSRRQRPRPPRPRRSPGSGIPGPRPRVNGRPRRATRGHPYGASAAT